MTATATEVSGSPTLLVEGVVDLANVAALRDALSRMLLAHTGRTVLVDLDGVAVLDDVGIGILLGAAGRAREANGDLEVVCNVDALLEQFRRTRLDRALTIRATASG